MIGEIKNNFFEGCNQRDWKKVKGLYSEGAVIHGKNGDFKGGQAVVDLAKKWLEAIPDLKLTPVFACLENDVAVVHWRARGTEKGSVVKSGARKVAFHGINCFRIKEDKVIEHWVTVDYRMLNQDS